MSTATLERQSQPWFRRLYLPAYRVTDVARYTGTHSNTVATWHYGQVPVLPDRERRKPLNYLELVEVAFVAFFRRLHVSMYRIRKARDYVAQNFNFQYPFAQLKFKTEGYHVLMDYVQFDPTSEFNVIVADKGGQLAWEDMMGEKFAEFDYEYELALKWYPAGRQSLVVIDPRIAFGAPMVSGVPTWAVKGRWIANESAEEISNEFGLPNKAVEDGLRFEGINLNSGSVLGQKYP